MPVYLLLAMQAAGMITDYIGNKNQASMMKYGMQLQQAGIETNIEQLRLETEQSSLQSLRELRQNLGSQIAAFAARGTSTGAGSALGILNQSQSNFNADERVRRLNLLGKENQLRAGTAMSRLQYGSDVSKMWQGFASRSVNRFPSSVSGWEQLFKSAGSGV